MTLPEGIEPVDMSQAVVRLEPGDIVVLKATTALSDQAKADIMQSVRKVVPDGVKVMIVDTGFDVQVFRSAA